MTNEPAGVREASHRMPKRQVGSPNIDEAREQELLLIAAVGRTRCRQPRGPDGTLDEPRQTRGLDRGEIPRRSDIDYDDLINAGHLGLRTAIIRFDTGRFDTRLAACASVWIRWHITRLHPAEFGAVRLPASKAHRQLAQSASRLRRGPQGLRTRGDRSSRRVNCARIGRRLGLTEDDVAHGLRLIHGARTSAARRRR